MALTVLAGPASPVGASFGSESPDPQGSQTTLGSPTPTLPTPTSTVSEIGRAADAAAWTAFAAAVEVAERDEVVAAAAAWDVASGEAAASEVAAARLSAAATALNAGLVAAEAAVPATRASEGAAEAVVIAARDTEALLDELGSSFTAPDLLGSDDVAARRAATGATRWVRERNLSAAAAVRGRELVADAAAVRAFIGERPDTVSAATAAFYAQLSAAEARRTLAGLVARAVRADQDTVDRAWAALSPARFAVVTTALAQVGKPYVFDADGPEAFDCSGFTSFVWQAAGGVKMPSYSYTQAGLLTSVAAEDMVAGDLVFWDRGIDPETGRPAGHVAMYLGVDNLIVEAHGSGSVRVARYGTAFLSGFGKVPVL